MHAECGQLLKLQSMQLSYWTVSDSDYNQLDSRLKNQLQTCCQKWKWVNKLKKSNNQNVYSCEWTNGEISRAVDQIFTWNRILNSSNIQHLIMILLTSLCHKLKTFLSFWLWWSERKYFSTWILGRVSDPAKLTAVSSISQLTCTLTLHWHTPTNVNTQLLEANFLWDDLWWNRHYRMPDEFDLDVRVVYHCKFDSTRRFAQQYITH